MNRLMLEENGIQIDFSKLLSLLK